MVIQEAFARFADNELCEDDQGRTLTYQAARDAGLKLLAPFGAGRRLVFLLVRNTAPSLAAYCGCLVAGHAVLLLSAGIDRALLERLTGIYRPDLVLAPDHEQPVVHAVSQLSGGLHHDLGLLLSTSGSTGSPKLARFSFAAATANAEAIAQYLDITAAERPLLMLPFHYSFGYSILNSHLLRGAKLALTEYSITTREFWSRAASSGATSFSGVPFHYEILDKLGLHRLNLAAIRTLTQAGGRLSPALVEKFARAAEERGLRFFVMYGQTECGPRISYLPPGQAALRSDSIGVPIPGVRLELADEAGRFLAGESEGELVCISPGVMMGYATGRSDLARGDDLRGRLFTGDLAMRDEQGYFRINGRKSRFLKIQGNRVNLDDAEAGLKALGFAAACFGKDDTLWVAVEGSEPAANLKPRLIAALKVPPRSLNVLEIAAIPRTEAGKIRYGELQRLAEERQSA